MVSPKTPVVSIRVQTTPRIEHSEDQKELDALQELFLKHRFSISFFGHDDVTFYDTKDLSRDGFVPIYSRYCMPRKDFAAFVSVVKRLDAEQKKANQLLLDWARQDPNFPRC